MVRVQMPDEYIIEFVRLKVEFFCVDFPILESASSRLPQTTLQKNFSIWCFDICHRTGYIPRVSAAEFDVNFIFRLFAHGIDIGSFLKRRTNKLLEESVLRNLAV